MDNFGEICCRVFEQATNDYHLTDSVNAKVKNPYDGNDLRNGLYLKNWIDAVQWHLEDMIRDPDINPVMALAVKRHIDRSNQERTDLVEHIDDYFLGLFRYAEVKPTAIINTESPAWAIDRLSILVLKIYHMQRETERTDTNEAHIKECRNKLAVLIEQRDDLAAAIESLIANIAHGKVRMKVYRQMKMYNDPALNPVLYGEK